MRTILLLKATNQPLHNVERFLETRDYQITVVHRIHDAIYFITENRPDFALLSTELIPTDSVWLFDVLKQLTAVVLFAERITAKSLAVSQELKGCYLLEPPLTPLGFEQMLRRIDRDHRRQSQAASVLNKSHVLIMSALSDLALKALCTPTTSGAGAQRVQKVSKVTSFRVQTPRLAGFFVLAYGENRSLDAKWLSNLQQELKKYLCTVDAEALLDDPEEILVAEVHFPKWSKEQAEYIQQATHENAELVLAFFKDPAPIPAKTSARPDHIEISLRQLRGDAPVNFDVYVYLPQNARFVLYTPQGGTLYETQKEKLLADGIQSVHIHKRSFDDFRRQQTKEFLEASSATYR